MNEWLSVLEEAKSTMGFDAPVSVAWLSDIRPLLKRSRGVKSRSAVPIKDTLHSPRNKTRKYKTDGDLFMRAFFEFETSLLEELMSYPLFNCIYG